MNMNDLQPLRGQPLRHTHHCGVHGRLQGPAPPHLPSWEVPDERPHGTFVESSWRTLREVKSSSSGDERKTRGWFRCRVTGCSATWRAGRCFLQKSRCLRVSPGPQPPPSVEPTRGCTFNELVLIWSPCRSRQSQLIAAQLPPQSLPSGSLHPAELLQQRPAQTATVSNTDEGELLDESHHLRGGEESHSEQV